MTLESVLRSANEAASAAFDIALWDGDDYAKPKLQKVLELCKDLRQRTYYLDYFRIRRKVGTDNVIWLQRAIQRINLAIFTAAIWNDDTQDLEEACKDYFTKVIPRSIECTDKVVDAYLEIRIQLAYREILARMETTEEVDAMQVINSYCPDKLINYNLPANKSGKQNVLPRAQHIIDQFYSKVQNIPEDMERHFPKRRMRKTWQTVLIEDIDEKVQLIESPDESIPSAPVTQPEQKDVPDSNVSTTTPADSASQSSFKEYKDDGSDYQLDEDEDEEDDSTRSESNNSSSNKRKHDTAQSNQGKEKLRKLTVRWTSEENDAFKKGYQEFGFGRWGEIKKKYSKELGNRTFQQLKDKARTIARALKKDGQPLGIWEPALRQAT